MAPVASEDEVRDLEALLDHLDQVAESDHRKLTVSEILAAVGTRSFAPILLLAGSLVASPLSGIPAMPTATACVVFLVSVQLLLGRKDFWLPGWLLHCRVATRNFRVTLKWLRAPARFIDYFIRPRLTWLVRGMANKVIALLCLLIAAGMPFLELIPFSSSVAGTALAAFGLSLVSSDGLLALIAYLLFGATIGVVVYGHSLIF